MITVDTSGLKPLVARLEASSKNFKRDARRALVSVRRSSQTEASRAVLEQYSVNRKSIRAGLKVSGVDAAKMAFTLSGARTPIGLQNFEHIASPMFGVSVRALKSGGGKRLPHAFKTTVGNFGGGGGSSGRIFQRAIKGGKRVARLPIKALFGPSAADMMNNQKVSGRIVTFAANKLSAEVTRLVKVAING